MTLPNPWCCPDPRCSPLHQLQGTTTPLDQPTPGETFVCFGRMPEGIEFVYDGSEHANDLRQCTYTPLKGVLSFQENADDWRALQNAYTRALARLEPPAANPGEGRTDG